uniref:Hexosaminidase A (alpha polypeptide) n=1 Tax=Gouania willdenowi TaxID=441366 RepID=A0A8C5GAT6_GOUWI
FPMKCFRSGHLKMKQWHELKRNKLGPRLVDGVWPLPQTWSSSAGRVPLDPQNFYLVHGGKSAAQQGCSVLDVAFKRYFSLLFPDYNSALRFRQGTLFTVEVTVSQDDCEGYPNQDSSERYSLNVKGQLASLTADTVWGALRGLETFSQLVYQDDYNTYFVNETEIEDFPRFPFRGILLDTSRHYLPLQDIFKTLSHTFPNLSSQVSLGAYHPLTHIYTQSDVKAVISYFDSPGHTQSWGKGRVQRSHEDQYSLKPGVDWPSGIPNTAPVGPSAQSGPV